MSNKGRNRFDWGSKYLTNILQYSDSPDLSTWYPAGSRSGHSTKRKQLDRWNKNNINVNRPFKKIAFIGDSYCADLTSNNIDKKNRYSSWPELVAKHFNAEILQIGFPGQGFVSSFYNTYTMHWRAPGRNSILEQTDIIIACVSAPDRLPNRYGLPFSPNFADKINDKDWLQELLNFHEDLRPGLIPKNYLEACQSYYENIYVGNFHFIAQKGALRELDDMIKENQVIVWLPCFEESMCEYKPKNGAVGDRELFDLFERDAKKLYQNTLRNGMVEFGFGEDPSISNHMTKETQEILANYIINYIDNKHGSTIPITDILNEKNITAS